MLESALHAEQADAVLLIPLQRHFAAQSTSLFYTCASDQRRSISVEPVHLAHSSRRLGNSRCLAGEWRGLLRAPRCRAMAGQSFLLWEVFRSRSPIASMTTTCWSPHRSSTSRARYRYGRRGRQCLRGLAGTAARGPKCTRSRPAIFDEGKPKPFRLPFRLTGTHLTWPSGPRCYQPAQSSPQVRSISPRHERVAGIAASHLIHAAGRRDYYTVGPSQPQLGMSPLPTRCSQRSARISSCAFQVDNVRLIHSASANPSIATVAPASITLLLDRLAVVSLRVSLSTTGSIDFSDCRHRFRFGHAESRASRRARTARRVTLTPFPKALLPQSAHRQSLRSVALAYLPAVAPSTRRSPRATHRHHGAV